MVQKTGLGDNTGTYPATHPLSGCLPGSHFPGFHVLDLVVDLINDLVVCLKLEEGYYGGVVSGYSRK